MISNERAINIAKEQFPDFPIYDITDIGEELAFSYDTGEPPIPGIPFVCVNKNTGDVRYLTIPPIDNIRIIENGKSVTVNGQR